MKAEANFFKQLSTTKNYLIEKIRHTFSAHFANIRRTRAALFTKFAAHLPHIKQFKERALSAKVCRTLSLLLSHTLFQGFLEKVLGATNFSRGGGGCEVPCFLHIFKGGL